MQTENLQAVLETSHLQCYHLEDLNEVQNCHQHLENKCSINFGVGIG